MRKSCVDIIVEMSVISEMFQRERELTEMILSFLEDANKWVRVAAYKQLGPFIVTLQHGRLHERLF